MAGGDHGFARDLSIQTALRYRPQGFPLKRPMIQEIPTRRHEAHTALYAMYESTMSVQMCVKTYQYHHIWSASEMKYSILTTAVACQ